MAFIPFVEKLDKRSEFVIIQSIFKTANASKERVDFLRKIWKYYVNIIAPIEIACCVEFRIPINTLGA